MRHALTFRADGDARGDPIAVTLNLAELFQVFLEDALRLNAILKAAELEIEFRGTLAGKAINDPLRMAVGFDHPMLAEVGQVLGNGNLLKTEDGLEMTDAKLAVGEEMKNAKASPIAKTFVDLNQFQFHASGRIYWKGYVSI